MARILALDSSTDACSAAVYCDGKVQEVFAMAAQSHTKRLLPMVDEVLGRAGVRLSQLDAIAFGCGPGSFTGLRICLGVVQGLAYGAQLPVIPVSTLQAMAAGYYSRHTADASVPVLVALDARMNEVYWALFRQAEFRQTESRLEPLVEESVMAPDQVVSHAAVRALQGHLQGIGSGWQYPALAGLSTLSAQVDCWPRAEDIAILALDKYRAGHWISAEEARPTYLRDKISWRKRQRLRS